MRSKAILFSVLLMLPGTTVYAGNTYERPVKAFEFEPFVGATYGLAGNVGSHKAGPAFGIEARYNFRHAPVDVGMQIYMGTALSRYQGGDLSCRTFSIMPVCDYNFNPGKKVSPFVGIGVGPNIYDIIVGSYDNDRTDGTSNIGIMPRVGVELGRHLRFTLNAHLGKRIYNTVGLSIGYTFGGGLK